MVKEYAASTQQTVLTESEMAVWRWLVSRGISNSVSGLSKMIGCQLDVSEFEVSRIMAKDTANLLGEPEKTLVVIYLTITGDATGHIILAQDPAEAFSIVDNQMQLAPGSTSELGEMELSLLGEMGNIVGAFFLNVLADVTNLNLSPSPPVVMISPVHQIVDNALGNVVWEKDTLFTVRAAFGPCGQKRHGAFLVIPTMDFMQTVIERVRVTR